MKTALLLLLLSPASAFAANAARPVIRAVMPSSLLGPMRLQTPGVTGMGSLRVLSAPAVSLGLGLSAPALQIPAAPLVAAQLPLVSVQSPAPGELAPQATLLDALKAQSPAQASADHPGASEDASQGWSDGVRRFDGGSGNGGGSTFVDPNSWQYRRLNGSEQGKLNATLRYGAEGSQVFQALNSEFKAKGGYYLLDGDRNAKYMASAAVDADRRPVIVLTHDLLNRYNGRAEDMYRGAPWEFIASVIAREQVFYNAWYGAIPASAEKLAVSFMNMTRVFVDLTNGTSRSWATDKDYQAVAGDRSTYTQWNWFEQLVAAARDAAQGAGTDAGHLIESKFFSWVRDWTAPQDKAAEPAFQYSLWEQYDGKYYRPGDAKHGQPLPADAPRIDKATYDSASRTAYGADGKGRAQEGGLDQQTAYGWIIQWLKDRFEL